MTNKIDTAFILCAGYGTRLRPLTDTTPKPLLEINSQPILCRILDSLLSLGIKKFIINTHHLSEKFESFFKAKNGYGKYKCADIVIVKEQNILDTGGGLKNILNIIDQSKPILIHNGDIFFDAPLNDFITTSEKNSESPNSYATVCIRKNTSGRGNVGIVKNTVVDMRFTTNILPEKIVQYTGVCIVNPPLYKLVAKTKNDVFSIVETFLESIKSIPNSISAFEENRGTWCDIGTPEDFVAINTQSQNSRSVQIAKLLTKNFFPSTTNDIDKGGSARNFFRFSDPSKGDLIACFYSDEKRENFLYASIADFLKKNEFPVPQIHYHDSKEKLLVMSDMGKTDLLTCGANFELYKKVVLEIKRLHTTITQNFLKNPFELSPAFDDALYDWEQNYFFEEFIKGKLNLEIERPQDDLNLIKSTLKSFPQSLLHRDLQSQNIIVSENSSIGFIDFQGMRLGNPYYDLASLLFDPYLAIPQSMRDTLFDIYTDSDNSPQTKRMFYIAAVERLMQALGAYGFLTTKRNKKEYNQFIKPALENLTFCAQNLNILQFLKGREIGEVNSHSDTD